MSRRKTITRRDRNRLIKVTRGKAHTLRWAMFIDKLQRHLDRARGVEPHSIAREVVPMDSTIGSTNERSD